MLLSVDSSMLEGIVLYHLCTVEKMQIHPEINFNKAGVYIVDRHCLSPVRKVVIYPAKCIFLDSLGKRWYHRCDRKF